MIYKLVYEYEGKGGYPLEKELTRKTLKGFTTALEKLMEQKHIAIRYVTPNLVDNDLVNKLPNQLW